MTESAWLSGSSQSNIWPYIANESVLVPLKKLVPMHPYFWQLKVCVLRQEKALDFPNIPSSMNYFQKIVCCPPLQFTKIIKLLQLFYQISSIRMFEVGWGTFWIFKKFTVVPLCWPWGCCGPATPIHLTHIFKNMFLSVASNCFDQKNAFRQFSENFKLLWSPLCWPWHCLWSPPMYLTYCGLPFVDPGVACAPPPPPPMHLTQIFKNMFWSVQTNCFDERNAFRQFSQSFE
jgi:hypothetical protein